MTKDPRSIVRRQAAPGSVSQPLVTPLWPTVAYTSTDPDELDSHYEGRVQGYTYAREGHPNATIVGQKIDWMEGVTPEMGKGVVTGSGMGAISALFLGLLKTGDHIVAGDQLYGRSLRLLTQDLPRLGFEASLADPTDANAFAKVIRPETKMILVEAVSNPTLRVADMEGIAKIAKNNGLLLVVDNTFTTPRSYLPFKHGADVVIHSITKMLAGHSDVTLGWIAARTPEHNKAISDAVITWGLTPSPFDCWLAERGLHTFELRFDRAQSNAGALAEALSKMGGVESVLYPGRPDHPDHNRAKALLGENCANMISFRLKNSRNTANSFVQAAKNIAFAPTLGDVGTVLSHPASSSHRGLTPEGRAKLGITEGFFRISVGCEDIDLLISEFTEAVAATM